MGERGRHRPLPTPDRRRSTAPRARRRPSRFLRAAVVLASAAVVAATGAGWWTVHGLLSGISVSQALGNDAPRSTGQSVNVLLIGLDSRKDQNGNDLPQETLDLLHAGDSSSGGYNTNTLILVHVAADGHVEAFSIPRDDYVNVAGNVPGYDHIKIKEAYGLAKADEEQKLVDGGVTDQVALETQGREAGRTATLAVVRALTGVPIDYFAEVNLAGFYDVATNLGGVEVCLNHAVHDDYSGADFPAGRQTLDAQQALAFVRQRHGLDNGDLDRTHRQQAFLVSVLRQLQDSRTFTDLAKLNTLVDVARKDIVLSQGWGQDMFRRIGALAGGNVRYQTLPVLRYDSINGQDVNIIDPAAIRALVTTTFGEASSPSTVGPPSAATVDVVNAGSVPGIAAEASNLLSHNGFLTGDVRGPLLGESPSTAVDYGAGAESSAQMVATTLGITAQAQANPDVATGHVRVVLGDGYTLATDLGTPAMAPAAGDSLPVGVGTSDPAPDKGAPISGGDIPCVN
jgi:LCP family protein required for cell wall assembly